MVDNNNLCITVSRTKVDMLISVQFNNILDKLHQSQTDSSYLQNKYENVGRLRDKFEEN